MGSRKSRPKLDSWVNVAMTREDVERLKKDAASSTCRKFSPYIRKLLLGKPVQIFYRNQSFDTFIEEAVALRNEMQTIRDKAPFTQESADRLIAVQEEIKLIINKIYDHVRNYRKESGNT